jgi:hypothetical protein
MTPSDNHGDSMTEHLSELHLQLQAWLPGYVDGELDQQQVRTLEAHLAGCSECRAEFERQRSLSLRLQQVATQRMSPELHRRLDAMLDKAPPRATLKPNQPRRLRLPRWTARLVKPVVIGATGWALALCLIAVMLLPGVMTSTQMPMMNDVLLEYQNLPQAGLTPQNPRPDADLPARLAGCKLVASWKTRVGGEPAEAFALQRGEHLIIEYRITESVFYRNPDVRQAIADFGDYRIREKELEVLALPLKGAGLLIVGPVDAIPHRREFIL